VPAAPAPKLALGQAQAQAAAPGAPARTIPIRNLAPPPPPKGNLTLKILKVAGVVAVVGACAYFGFILIGKWQDKANADRKAEEAKNSGESQVGHIANLNAMLDATEPGHFPGERRGSKRPNMAATPDPDEAGPAGAADKQLQVIPPVWTLDLAAAKIPEGQANGKISGSNFVVETATVVPSGSAQVLRLAQGSPVSPDRAMLIYLHLKPGEKLGGQTFAVAQDMKQSVPSVGKQWKTDPRLPLQSKGFPSGYAMKLELGAPTNGAVPGKIFLALPDPEQSVVAGLFKVALPSVDSLMQAPAAAPIPTAGNAAQADAMRKRYGFGK
jgi:hypothetical protein